MTALEKEVRRLLKLLAADHGPYEPNTKCSSPVCKSLGRIQKLLEVKGA